MSYVLIKMKSVLLGIKNHVVCLCAATGNEFWRVRLSGHSVTTLVQVNDNVFAYSGGKAFCLDVDSGRVKWINKLPGLAYGPCCIFCHSDEKNNQQFQSQQSAIANEYMESIKRF